MTDARVMRDPFKSTASSTRYIAVLLTVAALVLLYALAWKPWNDAQQRDLRAVNQASLCYHAPEGTPGC